MASVDGRIDCDMTEKIESGDEYYEALKELDLPTTVSGKVTAALHYALPGEFVPKNMAPIGKEDVYKTADSETFALMFDTKGSLLWEENHTDGVPLLCVVSEQATIEYLEYLRKLNISYIACGEKQIDLHRVVEILAEQFGVNRLGIVGGGKINGSFLAAGLLDEMSLMIAPGIDGRSNQPSVFDGIDYNATPVKLELTDVRRYDCGTVWMRYKFKR